MAYEVLADPQERAWYDSHSDAFLGTQGGFERDQHSYNIRITTAEDIFKIFSKFSPRMEFSDSPTGFFGGLREQFAQLALEERLACQWEDQDIVEYPSFGTRDDDFETVVRPFYATWTGFSTRKSFAWKDAYRYSEAPDRRVRRLMEKENRRLRDEAIREFNDAVRSLVAFVKKRDPRYKANAQSEIQRQETLRQSVAAQAARSRAINQAKMREHVVPQWAQSEEHVSEDEQSSESEVESFECVACHKHFKSQKQFEAHERSKKHLKAIKQLRREMLMQDEELKLEPASKTGASDQSPATSPIPEPRNDRIGCVDDEDVHTHIPVPTIKHSPGSVTDEARAIESDVTDFSGPGDDSKSTEDEDYASRDVVETRIRADLDTLPGEDPVTSLTEVLSTTGLTDQRPAPQPGKAKQRRAKKAARGGGQPTDPICAHCHAAFASRTKLFAHIKDNPSHAQPVATSKSRRR